MKRHAVGIALLAAGLAALVGAAAAETFKDGETVCFLGDSITAGGRYQTMIANYYLTRFPERTLWFVNAGRSGDTASGALGRLKEDVLDKKPTSVVIMFGMNDVSRSLYVAKPDEKRRAAQKQALDWYKTNMEKVVARIRAEAGQPRLLLCTPTPFDQTVVLAKDNNQPGCNDGLGRCAELVRALATKNKATVVDFHGPMTALNLERQKKDPKWTIVGPDRVHPAAPGHLVMAWLLLKAQGAPAVVSRIKVDAAACKLLESVNAEVTGVEKKPQGIAFTVLAKALPLPIDSSARPALELVPIEKDLNQELLTVTGLGKGPFELRIDGATVGRYTSAELARGVNLALNDATPQFKQAQTVAKHYESRRNAEAQACSLMNTRRWMQSHDKINVDDMAAVRTHYDRMSDKSSYNAAMALNYIKNWAKYEDLRKEVATHEKDALAARHPVPHAYLIVPAASK